MRRLSAPLLTLVALALAATPAAATPGQIYVTNWGSSTPPPNGTILKVPAKGGDASTFVNSPLLKFPTGMLLDPKGNLLVADYGTNRIAAVSRAHGTVSNFATGAAIPDPIGITRGADGQLYVINDDPPSIARLNPKTKTSVTLASGSGGWTGTAGTGGIVRTRSGVIYFTDSGNEVFRLLPGASTATVYKANPVLNGADGLLLSPDERTLYVAAYSTNDLGKIDLVTGAVTKVAQYTDIVSVAQLPSGALLASNTNLGKLQILQPGSTTPADFSGGPAFNNYAHDIVIEPAKCAGKFPTIVGTNAKDVIKGSKYPDVISTLGGNDKIKGLNGNDTICGGKGNDKITGGNGKDKLLGAAGKDKLLGNKGKDVVKGGKGKDRVKP